MSRSKVTPEQRIDAALSYLNGEGSYKSIADRFGVEQTRIKVWVKQYKANGPLAFKEQQHNTVYNPELKLNAVLDYLSGKGSIQTIAAKYGLRSTQTLENWIKVYNSGKDFEHKMSGGSHMNKARKTTFQERITIVKDCLENSSNYGETAIKYNVSYQQVYTWVKKFSQLGEAGLEDRRGKRIQKQEARSEIEELKIKMAKLEHELYMTKMERDLLKKLEELERGDAYRK